MALPWRKRPTNTDLEATLAPRSNPPFQYEEERILRMAAKPGDVSLKISQDNQDLYVHLRGKTDKAEIKLTFEQWQELERLVLQGVLEFAAASRY